MSQTHLSSRTARRSRRTQQRGVALVTTLLLLLLLTAISLTMVLSVSSDMLINGYYRSYRGSFYASDAGVNIARQDMITRVLNAAPVGAFNPAAAPIPLNIGTTVQAAVIADYAVPFAVNSAGSWPEQFQVVNTAANPTALTLTTCTVTGGLPGATCAAPTFSAASPITAYTYVFNYQVSTVGSSQGTEVATISDAGTLTFNGAITPAGPIVVAFAAWGMFIDQYPICSGDLVPGTITGPVFTNGAWTWGNAGNYIYTDPVGSVSAKAGFDNGGCSQIAGSSGNGITPTFQSGLNLGQPAIALPANSFNQEQAVLDGIGNSATAPTNAQLNAALKSVTGAAYPAAGAATGVFLPYSVNASTGAKTFTGGGVYVQGSATVKLAPSGTSAEVYTITQGATVTTVTIDPVANTTVIASGASTQTITGVPDLISSAGVVQGPATMLYVNGDITGLAGPGQGQAGIQNGDALTVASSGNVTVTGDILYKAEPVTLTASGSTPIDTLIPANNTGQVLGIFTASGNIQMANTQANGNLEIDASIAAISQGGSGGLVNTGSTINNLTIVGGRIQNTIQNIGATTRNVLFDRRFAAGGFAPPWFPSTTVTPGGAASANFGSPTVQHTQWLNKTINQ